MGTGIGSRPETRPGLVPEGSATVSEFCARRVGNGLGSSPGGTPGCTPCRTPSGCPWIPNAPGSFPHDAATGCPWDGNAPDNVFAWPEPGNAPGCSLQTSPGCSPGCSSPGKSPPLTHMAGQHLVALLAAHYWVVCFLAVPAFQMHQFFPQMLLAAPHMWGSQAWKASQ